MRALAALMAAALGLLGAACTSDDDALPAGGSTATVAATSTPSRIVEAADLDLPEGCSLFSEGFAARPLRAGAPVEFEVRLAACAGAAIGDAAGIALEWVPFGLDGPVVRATFAPATSTRWSARLTFPEPGAWHAGSNVGVVSFVEVIAAEDGLVERYAGLPLPSAPSEVAVLDAAGSSVLRAFSADFGGVGLLRDPDRVLFALPRQGGTSIVIGDIEAGTIETVLDTSWFPQLYSAPDGRAVAVQWSESNRRSQRLALIDATGAVVARLEDDSGSGLRVAWSPDSRTLLVAGTKLWVLDAGGTIRDERPLSGIEAPWLWWAPDSGYALLRFFGQSTRVVRLDAATLQEDVVLPGTVGVRLTALESIAFSPDGERVAAAWTAGDGGPINLSIVPAGELVGGASTITSPRRSSRGPGPSGSSADCHGHSTAARSRSLGSACRSGASPRRRPAHWSGCSIPAPGMSVAWPPRRSSTPRTSPSRRGRRTAARSSPCASPAPPAVRALRAST